ncbi:MAG TPA: S8 family serine peptidase, partial [Candidatus Obscuribacterales bacterium]
MGWSWSHRKNSNKNQAQSKTGHKKQNRKRKTFILEEIITPSIALPIADLDAKICPVDGGMIDFPPTNDLPPIFTGEELDIDFLIPDPSPENFDYTVPAIVPDDTELTADLIALENNTNVEDFINIQDLLDQISNGDLPAFINPIALTGLTAQPDIIGAIESLPPPVILPIDPPGSQPNLSSNNPINDFPSVTQPKNNVAETSDLNLSSETLSNLNHDLTQIRELIDHNNSGSLFDTLSSEEAETALERITDVFGNNSALVELLAQPDELSKIGFEPANIQVIKDFLNNPKIAESMGLPMLLGEALSNPDSTVLDRFLLNADQAHYLLPINAKQPSVGIIDFAQKQHGKQVKEIFNSINPLVNPRNYTVKNNDWATELVKYVNYLKSQGQTRGIVNLSFDLSQLDDVGVTTRYELTQQELSALQYARDHNILVVAASGNTGGTMSALGKASQQFDNLITVGAVNQFEAKTDYSAYGNGLTVVAPGGSWQDDPKAFVGTSRATSYVTAAASLVWASNPDLSWQQVKHLLIETARDLNTPGWDAETGAGLIDIQEAISRAQLIPPQTAPETLQVIAPEFSGINRVRVLARPTSENTADAIANLIQNQENLGLQWQTLIDLENPDLDLETLKTTVKERINQAFEQYQQVNTDQAIAQVELEQIQDALNLAISHYQIERERLNKLQTQKQQLETNLATLGEQKTALEAETKQLLESIQQEIINVEASLEKAKAKLINPFA